MKIGIDFDNTIACYDGVFHQLATEKKLIPESLSTGKDDVRDYLRSINKEDLWTEMQGFIYGPGIDRARMFVGFTSFILSCREKGIGLVIVSHKTRSPFRGPKYDLHESAKNWLAKNNFFKSIADNGLGFKEEDAFFELTKEEKCARISKEKCDVFIDDLPEILTDTCFPSFVRKILFKPSTSENFIVLKGIESFSSWNLLREQLLT